MNKTLFYCLLIAGLLILADLALGSTRRLAHLLVIDVPRGILIGLVAVGLAVLVRRVKLPRLGRRKK